MSAIERRSWQEFRESKLLWFVNRLLHAFGWAIVCCVEADGSVSDVYPARVTFRGFSLEDEEDGYRGIRKAMADAATSPIED